MTSPASQAADRESVADSESGALEALMQFLYQAPIGLLRIRGDGSIDMLNPTSARLLMPLAAGGSLENLFDVLRGVAPQLRDTVAGFGDRSGLVCEGLRLPVSRNAAGGVLVASLSVIKLSPERYMASLVDVTLDVARESKGVERRLHDAARVDGLTRLPNRTAAVETLREALAAADPIEASRRVAVLFLDGDRFRRINDGFGHAAGDAILTRIGERLLATLAASAPLGSRPGLPLAARLGGDEFAVVLDNVRSTGEPEALAEQLLLALALPHLVGGQRVHAPMSIGVAVAEAGASDPEQLLHDAGLAMVEAKRAGGGRSVAFAPSLREQAARRSALEEELRRALVEDQLFVVYQPVVGLQGSAGVDHGAGVEALVRWRHPTRGLVGPNEFIPVAEEAGLIGRLGAFVLDTACAQHAAWRAELGAAAPRLLAVNLSRAQLDEADLVSRVADTLARHAMAPSALQLEVTESLAAQDQRVQARLRELKAIGLTLALDDFGTGYSSLASLHQLPVDTVKIDRAFVQHVDTSDHHRALVEATVKVARTLGMGTVAEGVETAEQARVVRELGCDKGQGWFFGKPMEGPALALWLASRSPARAAPCPIAETERARAVEAS